MSGGMVRLDRQRLQNAALSDRIEIATRFDDLDLQGHVNNVAVAVLLQEARGTFNKRRVAQFLGEGRALVVGSLSIEYAGTMHYPEPVEIETGVLEIGRSSYVLGQIVHQNGRATAFAEVAMVMTQEGRATAIPAEMRSGLEAILITS
jgi:acyl-CoA thioester hydrolase